MALSPPAIIPAQTSSTGIHTSLVIMHGRRILG
jgi:hypothetical protein